MYLRVKNLRSYNLSKTSFVQFRTMRLGFPGGTVVKSPPANAGDTGSSPGSGRSHIPQSSWARVPQLLSLCSGARRPQLLSPRAATTEAHAPGACAPQREATAMRSPCTAMRSGPRSLQLERACAAMKTQCSQINK